jgi:RNA polymerase sigma-70 factor (ECF subfamily)
MHGQERHADAADADLVRLAAAGDREAFASLYMRYQSAIYRFALHMTGSAATAEDVVHDVFVAFMRNLARFDEERSLAAYLYGIARNIIVRRRHRDRRWVSFDPNADLLQRVSDGAPLVAQHLEDEDHLRLLRHAIVALPRKYREVIVLCDLHRLSYETAATAIGCPVGTIRSRLHRARDLLATRLQQKTASVDRLSRSRVGCAL